MRSNRRPPRMTRSGFALPAVLAVTGVVTLIFLVAITALNSLNAEARSARERIAFMQRALTAEARLSYLMATEPLRSQGLQIGGPRDWGEDMALIQIDEGQTPLVRVDSRPYLLDINGPLVVRLQDQAGLINLNSLSNRQDQSLGRFLESLGIDSGLHGQIEARLIDYQDTDRLRQADGAEDEAYRNGGPPNRRLLHPSEFLSVAGVRQNVSKRAWNGLKQDLAADSISGNFNLNTATPRALSIQLGLTPAQIETLLAERNRRAIINTTDFDQLIGRVTVWEEDRFYTFPSSALILSIRDSKSAWTYRARLAMSPSGLERPIWVDQIEMSEARGRARADTSNVIQLPYSAY